MNFFEHQEQARRQTKWLVFLFLLAILSLVILTDIFIVLLVVAEQLQNNSISAHSLIEALPVKTHFLIACGVIFVISLACLYKFFHLKKGGFIIANDLGAHYISPSTKDPDEKKLLNVVEEMAIASGSPIPSVYLLEDSAINAFAAGYSSHDAVIGITRGAIQLLNRVELQGVIAHEFSHIFNGDMRLNLKLIGMLYGITFISLIGKKILHATHISRQSARKNNMIAIIFLGFGLILIGSIGMLFGNMIKAAIGRQREYLADASAVQFTRDPQSIAGALKKIGGWPVGSVLLARNAAEYSHFYIANGLNQFAAGFFKTHPPLEDRIKRIDPRWDGEYPKVKRPKASFAQAVQKDKEKIHAPSSSITVASLAAAIDGIGAPSDNHVEYAQQLIADIPGNLLDTAHSPGSAYILALALSLNEDSSQWQAQIKHLDTTADFRIVDQLNKMLPSLAAVKPQHRLPLIELCISSLKLLPEPEQEHFKRDLKLIIHHDEKLELWEWVLYRLFTLAFNKPDRSDTRTYKLTRLEKECRLLIAAIAYTGANKTHLAEPAFFKAVAKLGLSSELPSKKDINGSNLNTALTKIRHLKPLEKPRLLKAFCAAAQTDGNIGYREVELIRMIAEGIDCPMPPLLVTQQAP